jgi:hypothetical protein
VLTLLKETVVDPSPLSSCILYGRGLDLKEIRQGVNQGAAQREREHDTPSQCKT